MRYVIVGNSYAGIAAVEGIRERDKKGEITIISDEPYGAYARPLISYFLGNRVGQRGMYYRPSVFYKRAGVKLLLGKRVEGIHCGDGIVRIAHGESVKYDRLLIGTGGRPFVPPMEGSGAGNVFTFTKWDDAKEIKKSAKGKRKAVVIGGGLIGLKAAEGLCDAGLKVTIVELGPRMLALALDEVSGRLVGQQLKSRGIRTLTGHTAKEIVSDGRGDVCGVTLDDGRRLDCGILIIAIGVRPNIEIVRHSAVRAERGIVVDRHMRTSADGVYAAGDVVEAWDVLNRRNSVIAILPLACEQGRIAGRNMAGDNRVYAGGIAMNSVEINGLPVMTLGISNSGAPTLDVHVFRAGRIYRKLVFEGNRLVGAVLIGDIACGGVLTHLIRSQADIRDLRGELTGPVLQRGDFGPLMLKTSSLVA